MKTHENQSNKPVHRESNLRPIDISQIPWAEKGRLVSCDELTLKEDGTFQTHDGHRFSKYDGYLFENLAKGRFLALSRQENVDESDDIEPIATVQEIFRGENDFIVLRAGGKYWHICPLEQRYGLGTEGIARESFVRDMQRDSAAAADVSGAEEKQLVVQQEVIGELQKIIGDGGHAVIVRNLRAEARGAAAGLMEAPPERLPYELSTQEEERYLDFLRRLLREGSQAVKELVFREAPAVSLLEKKTAPVQREPLTRGDLEMFVPHLNRLQDEQKQRLEPAQ